MPDRTLGIGDVVYENFVRDDESGREVRADGGAVVDDGDELAGRPARGVDSLTGMLGWNSVGVFATNEYFDGETLHVNRNAVFAVLTDPYPEYREFVWLDGDYHHASDLLSMEYEGVFEEHFHQHGEATIYPLDAVDCIERDDNGIPQYVGSESDKVATDGGTDVHEPNQVIVSASAARYGNTTYHCDSDCRYVKRMAETLTKPLVAIRATYDPCSVCVPSEPDGQPGTETKEVETRA
jgi:hypothetical protein